MTTAEFLASAHAPRALLAAGKLLLCTGPAREVTKAMIVHRAVRSLSRKARTPLGRVRLLGLGVAFDMLHGRTPEWFRARAAERAAARTVAR